MKVVLSRKGFDSKFGGMPSPILPDGTLLSLPIPYVHGRPYSTLTYNGETYEEIIRQLHPKFDHDTCHLDPDIRQGVFDAPAEWVSVFGQDSGALTHLHKQAVGIGDLFLFFGWFKQTERGEDGKLRYARKAPNLHIIYGYLQVGDMIIDKAEIKKYGWHPHANIANDKNCLFIARETCSWNENLQGAGVFFYDKRLVLTKDGMSRRCWELPDFFKKLKITYHNKNSWHNNLGVEYFQSADIGQEFVIEENPNVENWARDLVVLNNHISFAHGLVCGVESCVYKNQTNKCVLKRLSIDKDGKCGDYLHANMNSLSPLNHLNYGNSGKIYCRIRHELIKSLDSCYDCSLLAGSLQGEGVECHWDDVLSGGFMRFDDPKRELLRVSNLIDIGYLDRGPSREGSKIMDVINL